MTGNQNSFRPGWRKWALVAALAAPFGIGAGLVIPQAFSPTTAQAGLNTAPTPLPWKEVHVAFFVSDSTKVPAAFRLDGPSSDANVTMPVDGIGLTNLGVPEQSLLGVAGSVDAQPAIDVLAFDNPNLSKIDRKWLQRQVKNGMGIVALNVSPGELADLIGFPALAAREMTKPAGDSVILIQFSGEPDQIAQALRRPDFFSGLPTVSYRLGYADVTNLTLAYAIDNLRFDRLPSTTQGSR